MGRKADGTNNIRHGEEMSKATTIDSMARSIVMGLHQSDHEYIVRMLTTYEKAGLITINDQKPLPWAKPKETKDV